MVIEYRGVAKGDYIKTKANEYYQVVEILPSYDGYYCTNKQNYNYFIPASDVLGRCIRSKQLEVKNG